MHQHHLYLHKVLGAKPLENACHLPTHQLARAMMDYLKASDDVQEVYTKHLALLVCDCGEKVLLLPLRIVQMHG